MSAIKTWLNSSYRSKACFFTTVASLALGLSVSMGAYGQTKYIPITPTGCNATALTQLPSAPEFFIGRQMLDSDGSIAGLGGPNNCSGANPGNPKAGKIFNRWSLVLDRLDWTTHQLTLIKPILDTSVDPGIGHARSVITDGPMRGLIIRSAYDASVAFFHGQWLVAFECTTDNGDRYDVDGTSSCLGVYDPKRQVIDLSKTQVIVSGIHTGNGAFTAAAVPELLVDQGHLFIYWSALAMTNGKFDSITTRGAEIQAADKTWVIKGSHGQLVHAADDTTTSAVWKPELGDPRSNSMADIRALWVGNHSIIAMASLGGGHCTAPSDKDKGCFRLGIVKSTHPLGEGVFNRAEKVSEQALPSNPQEYTRPVKAPDGTYWFIGHFIRPVANQDSELRPMPDMQFWDKTKQDAILLMYPIADKSLWPTD
jgi:hypothetical protein